jgi:hypothetical protein
MFYYQNQIRNSSQQLHPLAIKTIHIHPLIPPILLRLFVDWIYLSSTWGNEKQYSHYRKANLDL